MNERKILIVDDDIQVVRALGKTFTTILPGYLLLTATSGNEGLVMIKSQNPEVVVVDVRLGRESGMDLVKEFSVHATQKWQRSPRFIVMTAYADEAVRKEAIENYKADKFLVKPFADGEIEEAVLESLEKVVQEDYERDMKQITSARKYKGRIKEKAKSAQDQILKDREKTGEQ